MPKQLYKIVQFHGGLNSNSDPRDIAENELSEAIDVMVDELGKIRMMGGTAQHYNYTNTANTPANDAVITAGYGLFQWSHDRLEGETAGTAAAETGDDYLAMIDADGDATVDIYSRVENTWGQAKFDTGSTTGSKASFYAADGSIRIADGNFGAGNGPVWYGYIYRQFFGNGNLGLDTGPFSSGILVDRWVGEHAAPIALTLSGVEGETGNYSVTSPTASNEVAVQLVITSNANKYVDTNRVVAGDNATSSTIKVRKYGTFAKADNSWTSSNGTGDSR